MLLIYISFCVYVYVYVHLTLGNINEYSTDYIEISINVSSFKFYGAAQFKIKQNSCVFIVFKPGTRLVS